MQPYTLMHRNTEVASIAPDGGCQVFARAFLPYNLYLESTSRHTPDIDTRVNNLSNFYYWCSSRMLTLDRKYAKEILNSLGKRQAVTDRDRAEICLSYKALSLTDVYWVRAQGEHAQFEEVNLYDHSLSDAFVDVSLRGRSLTAENAELLDPQDAAGDIATQGVAPKAWIRRDGTFYLLKDGDPRDVAAELLASRIADCFNIDHVRYTRSDYDGAPVTVSRLITSHAQSIVPAEHVEIYAANKGLTLHDMVFSLDARGYHAMNLLDYLVGNTDRHWGNWGFWVDNDTNKLQRLHSLMDFNKAFTSYDTVDGAMCQTAPRRISQKDAALEAVREIGVPQTEEILREWFPHEEWWEMFRKRMEVVKAEV